MVVLMNGSFRGKSSNSNYFLDVLETQLNEKCERVHLNQMKDIETMAEKLKAADVLVIGMPLYVDGVPAQVVEFMENMYQAYKGQYQNLRVYVVSNLGFYESEQIRIQLETVKNWCNKMGMVYGGGLAIGAGEMLGGMSNVPINQGPNKKLGEGMGKLADAITRRECIANIYVEPAGFPRAFYMMAANMSWGRNVKKNGLTKKDLYRKMV